MFPCTCVGVRTCVDTRAYLSLCHRIFFVARRRSAAIERMTPFRHSQVFVALQAAVCVCVCVCVCVYVCVRARVSTCLVHVPEAKTTKTFDQLPRHSIKVPKVRGSVVGVQSANVVLAAKASSTPTPA